MILIYHWMPSLLFLTRLLGSWKEKWTEIRSFCTTRACENPAEKWELHISKYGPSNPVSKWFISWHYLSSKALMKVNFPRMFILASVSFWPLSIIELVARVVPAHLRLLLTQRFLAFWCVPCVKIKDTDDVFPVKEARNSRDGNYSFEFCPLHAAHA